MPTNLPPSPPDRPADVRFTGAVYTPRNVAAAMVARVRELLPDEGLRILEPSVGDGAFLRELRRRRLGDQFTLVDVDKAVITELERYDKAPGGTRSAFHAADFLDFALPLLGSGETQFDLIIGNPPFIRSRNFSEASRRSVAAVAQKVDYPERDLKNSWAVFLAANSHLVAPAGVLAFVLPYEILTVTYGQAALKRLVKLFRRVDVYVSRARAFMDIDQDAVVLIAQKAGSDVPGLFMNKIDTLENLSGTAAQPLDLVDGADCSLELNAYLLRASTVAMLKDLRRRCCRLGDFADSAPGIVSAANRFFILKRSDVNRLNLGDVAQPILKRGSYASPRPIFTAQDFQTIADREPAHILRIRGERSELTPAVLAYVETGEAKGIHRGYKCSRRPRWYEVPFVPREKLFFFRRAHTYPRLCINEAGVYLTDTAYGLRLKKGVTARGVCFSFYNSLTLLFAETDGRFYGGGVLELSPTEFRGLPFVYHEPSDAEFASFLQAHDVSGGDPATIMEFGDRWLGPKLGLTIKQMQDLRSACASLKDHRLRHSGRSAPSETSSTAYNMGSSKAA